MNNRLSLDEIEKTAWNPGPSTIEHEHITVEFVTGDMIPRADDITSQSLNGEWLMVDGGYTHERIDINKPWDGAIKTDVPCSIHTALYNAGVIPDPMVGKNDKMARENSYKIWWLKRTFKLDKSLKNPKLVFEGICYRATIWLNGTYLGEHSGMFGGPWIDVSILLLEENTLIVKIENSPSDPRAYSEFADYDNGWKQGVVVNCVYGWHYACIPSRGIWAPVSLVSQPATLVEKPFIATIDAAKGIVDLCMKLKGDNRNGRLFCSISPDNFEGGNLNFTSDFEIKQEETYLHYRMQIPNPALWWPNGYGDQNLYKMTISIEPENDLVQHFEEIFGLRTIEMTSLPGGPYEDLHNWTFVVNGKPMFIKGANWCTTDALLRFPDERYDRFLELAKAQHIQLLRAWGGGMPESDYFYKCCDKLGIMVAQEWPTCWDSQKEQPMNELLETVVYGTLRLRNHPSLIMWAGGNESANANGEAMDAMARLAFEMDGSRSFHRTSPWGGSIHDYSTFWGMEDIDASLQLKSPFMSEFGMASAPNIKSVMRYLPDNEKNNWDLTAKNSFNYHTPRFNEYLWPESYNDIDHLTKRVTEFDSSDTMEQWINGTQMAQATAIRHTLEAYRSRWPESTGICYYKLTDVYPACSWSTIDYYGVQKLSYYVLQDSYQPLHACLIFNSTTAEKELDVPVFLLDDECKTAKNGCTVRIRAFDGSLKNIKSQTYIKGEQDSTVTALGNFKLTNEQLIDAPLFLVVEVIINGDIIDRTFYWINYRSQTGCLFNRNQTTLSFKIDNEKQITIYNQGNLPAIGVSVECYDKDTTFTVEDSVFWLDAGEKRSLQVNEIDNLTIKAWNAPIATLK